MAKIKPTPNDEYELAQIRYEQGSHQSSWSVETRTMGRNRFYGETVDDVCVQDNNSWTNDAQ